MRSGPKGKVPLTKERQADSVKIRQMPAESGEVQIRTRTNETEVVISFFN